MGGGVGSPTPKTGIDVTSNLVTCFFLFLGWGWGGYPWALWGSGGVGEAADVMAVLGRKMDLASRGGGTRTKAPSSGLLQGAFTPLVNGNNLIDEQTQV